MFCKAPCLRPYWFAEISIYNLTKAGDSESILNATWVTLEAGYQAGVAAKFSIIWDGPGASNNYSRVKMSWTSKSHLIVLLQSRLSTTTSSIFPNVGYASSQAQLIDADGSGNRRWV